MKWFVGTSGWSYPPWDGPFYPHDLPQREWLSFYAKHFNAVEINNSFYHLNKPQQYENWDKMVPKDFTFAVKGSRYITLYETAQSAAACPQGDLLKSLAFAKKNCAGDFPAARHILIKKPKRLEKFLSISAQAKALRHRIPRSILARLTMCIAANLLCK